MTPCPERGCLRPHHPQNPGCHVKYGQTAPERRYRTEADRG